MSKYTFTFKKDDIFVEFVTTDKDVVERQFQIWVADADDYARNQYSRTKRTATVSNPKPAPVEESYEESSNEETSKEHTEVPQSEPDKEVVSVESENAAPVQEQHAIVPEVSEEVEQLPEAEVKVEAEPENEQVYEQASTLLKTINTIQNPSEEPSVAQNVVNFEDVLEKSIENPTFEPTSSKDQIFLNLINSKNTNDKFHYLMVTAYYLSEFEKMERFSLKQINSKMMQNLMTVIDHSMLQEAINQNFIEVVPDLTGISEVAEYRLTNLGEEFFAKI